MARADKLFKRLTAARLDNTLDYEYRRLTTVDLLIIDDFALQPLTPAQTTDFYEVITERHRKTSTVVTSNRDASEWLPLRPTRCWPSQPSTGSPPPATNSSSKATPTAAASAPPHPQLTVQTQTRNDAHATG